MNEDPRIIELEIKLAYLEGTVKQLDSEVYRQQRQIDQLGSLCARLLDEIKASPDKTKSTTLEQEKPPHY